jgi:hypothetical protein
VAPGDTVRWTVASGAHQIESDSTSDKFWNSGYIDVPGQNYRVIFTYDDGAGPFPYHCLYHANRDTIFVADTCFATGVVLRDGPITVADVVYVTRLIGGDITPPPDALYRLDLNGDCVVDAFDLELFNCFFQIGLSCFDVYPVPTCCFPVLHTSSCPIPITGDIDTSGAVTANDIVALVAFMFRGGPAPEPCEATADVNCSGDVTASDVIYMVNYVFKAGPEPCDVCELVPGTWTCGE